MPDTNQYVSLPDGSYASFPSSMSDEQVTGALKSFHAQTAPAAPNSQYAKPGPYTTTLAPQQESQFQSWVKQNKVPWQDSPTSDYDMRGYYKAMQSGDPNAKQGSNMHFPDTWKTPYDASFSNESQYALPTAPKWKGNQLVDSKGKVVFDEALGSDGQQEARSAQSAPPQSGSPVSAQPAQPGLMSRAWNWANEGVFSQAHVEAGEKAAAIDPTTAEQVRQYQATISGKPEPETTTRFLGMDVPTDPAVYARAAAESLNQWYSPAQLALRALGIKAAKPGATLVTRVAASGVAVPMVGQQAYGLQQNWSQLTPTERAASAAGIVGGTILGGTGIAHEFTGKPGVLTTEQQNNLRDAHLAISGAISDPDDKNRITTQGKDPVQAFVDHAQSPSSPDKPVPTAVAPAPLAAGDPLEKQASETAKSPVVGQSKTGVVARPNPAIPPSTSQEKTSVPPRVNVSVDPNDSVEDKARKLASVVVDAGQGRVAIFPHIEAAATELGIKPNAIPDVWNMAWDQWKQKNLGKGGSTGQMLIGGRGVMEPVAGSIVAPEPPRDQALETLTQEQKGIATDATDRAKQTQATATTPMDEPLRRMVEESGGKWKGTDDNGLAHYDAPPSAVGGRDGVAIASAVTQMDPDYVKAQFDRKAGEFAPPTSDPKTDDPMNPAQTFNSVTQGFNRLAKLKLDYDNANTEAQRQQIAVARDNEIADSKTRIDLLMKTLQPDQLSLLRDHLNAQAKTHSDQADYITDTVKQHNQSATDRQAAIDRMAVGKTEETAGVDPITGEPTGGSRIEAETAPASRMFYHEQMGQKGRVSWDDFKTHETKKGVPPEEWQKFATGQLANLKATYTELQNRAEILKDTGQFLEESDIPEKLKELDKDAHYIGKFPVTEMRPPKEGSTSGKWGGPGRVKNLPVTDEAGNVRPMAPSEAISLARAQQMMGRKVNKIPEDSEFSQRAAELNENAKLHRAFGTAIDAKIGLRPADRPAERGAVGEAIEHPIVDAKEVSNDTMLAKAKAAGFNAWNVTKTKRAGLYGWLSEDGKIFISLGVGKDSTHSSIAETLLPQLATPLHDEAAMAMQQHGWMRKVTDNEYEAHNLSSLQISTIESGLLKDGVYGQSTIIDTKDATGRVRALRLDAGWGEKYNGLSEALGVEQRRMGMTGQMGKVSGTEIMGGMSIGMAAGGAVGGIPGAVIGGVLGATTPALLRSAPIARAWRYTSPMREALSISPTNWFRAAPTDGSPVSPEMGAILHDQLQSTKAPEAQLSFRQQMVSGMWKKLDQYALITDRPNPLQDWTMKQDPRGKGFRDSKGQLSIDESPYAAVRNAVTGIRGSVGVAREMLGAIERDARAAGVHTDTTQYLNLKGYERAYQVVDEHMQALAGETQQLKSQLALEDDVVKQVGLHNHITANIEALKEQGQRVKEGKIVPGGYTPETIQRDLQAIQQKNTPEKMGQIQSFAKRVYDMHRQSLDLISDQANGGKSGIISKEAYQTYTARGDEYIPMQRIMETAADSSKRFYGKNSPLYLRQQNVIHQLQGSELTNVDPWQASGDAINEGIREFYRNKTLSTFLDAARKAPEIGKDFTPVHQDYKARTGEMVVGHYQDGAQKRYAVPQWLGESLDNSSMLQASTSLKIVNAATHIFKGLATAANPVWMVSTALPNIIGRQFITAEGPKYSSMFEKMMKDPGAIGSAFKDAVVSTWAHDDKWMEAAKTGLTRNSLMQVLYPEDRLNSRQLGAKGPFTNIAKAPLESIRALSEIIPSTVQQYHWNRLRQAGYSPEAATFKTIDRGPLPDYAKLGNGDGAVAAMTTFLRADWAHIRSDMALATDPEFNGRLAKAALAVSIATLPLVLHNIQQKDDKGNSLWDKVSDTDKEKYWVGLTGKSDDQGNPVYHKVGKPDFVRTFFNPMEDAMYKGMDKLQKTHADSRPISQLIANTASGFIPGHPNFDASAFTDARSTTQEVLGKTAMNVGSQITPAVRVPTEEAFNATDSFGSMRPIVTNPKLSAPMQGYGAKNVSPTAMDVGRMTNSSPQRLEHIARGMLGPAARYGEALTDPLLGKDYANATGTPLPDTQGATKMNMNPTAGTAINQSEITAQTKFYNTVQQATKINDDYAMLKRTNPQAAQQFQVAHAQELWRGQLATRLQSRLQDISASQQKVQASQMDAVTKSKVTQNLHEVKMNLMNTFQGLLTTTNKTTPGTGSGNATSQGTTK